MQCINVLFLRDIRSSNNGILFTDTSADNFCLLFCKMLENANTGKYWICVTASS